MGGSTQTQFPIANVKRELQAAICGGFPFSFSHERIWFQVGILWDANQLKDSVTTAKSGQRTAKLSPIASLDQ